MKQCSDAWVVWKANSLIEAAQRVVEAIEEVVSYELRGNRLHFNFDHRHRAPRIHIQPEA
jgi:hypothetical protein